MCRFPLSCSSYRPVGRNITTCLLADQSRLYPVCSLLSINTVTRQSLGGINLVDFPVFGGNFTGLVVSFIYLFDSEASESLADFNPSPFARFATTVPTRSSPRPLTCLQVTNNHVVAVSNLIKVGIGLGPSTWSNNVNPQRNFGGLVSNNYLSSGPLGYFGYGVSVGGHLNTTVTGTVIANGTNFGGEFSSVCYTNQPAPQVSDSSNPAFTLR